MKVGPCTPKKAIINKGFRKFTWVYLEHVQSRPGVETALLVNCTEDSRLGALLWSKGGGKIKLESLGDQVLELDLVAEHVGGRPRLGDGKPVDFVSPLTLNVPENVVFGIAMTLDLESDIGRGLGLHFQRDTVGVVVLEEQVARRLAKVLEKSDQRARRRY